LLRQGKGHRRSEVMSAYNEAEVTAVVFQKVKELSKKKAA